MRRSFFRKRKLLTVLALTLCLLVLAGCAAKQSEVTATMTDMAPDEHALGMLLQEEDTGLHVLAVREESFAARMGVVPGDIILRVNGTETGTFEGFETVLETAKDSGTIRLELIRDEDALVLESAYTRHSSR